ncbi:hypothetical protein GCM10027589_15130 [Actinocorallia lasiicapitis]
MKRARSVLLAVSMAAACLGTTVATASSAHAETKGSCFASQEGDHRWAYSLIQKKYIWFTCERGWWRSGYR